MPLPQPPPRPDSPASTSSPSSHMASITAEWGSEGRHCTHAPLIDVTLGSHTLQRGKEICAFFTTIMISFILSSRARLEEGAVGRNIQTLLHIFVIFFRLGVGWVGGCWSQTLHKWECGRNQQEENCYGRTSCTRGDAAQNVEQRQTCCKSLTLQHWWKEEKSTVRPVRSDITAAPMQAVTAGRKEIKEWERVRECVWGELGGPKRCACAPLWNSVRPLPWRKRRAAISRLSFCIVEVFFRASHYLHV